ADAPSGGGVEHRGERRGIAGLAALAIPARPLRSLFPVFGADLRRTPCERALLDARPREAGEAERGRSRRSVGSGRAKRFLLYSADMGFSGPSAQGGARLRTALLWAILALAAASVFALAAIPVIAPGSDLWDYSQEARQIARRQGCTSLYTYPVFLGHEGSPFPVLWRMPLYAVLGALLLKLGVPLPAGFLYLGAVAHALLVALTYWWGAKVHSS